LAEECPSFAAKCMNMQASLEGRFVRRIRQVILLIVLTTVTCSGCSCSSDTPTATGPQAAPPEFDAGRAFEFLTAQCDFGPRNPGSDAHEQCKQYLVHRLEESADSVELQTFDDPLYLQNGTFYLTNIIAHFGGEHGGLLLGAHWDCRPWADRDPDPANHNTPIAGASDGASGVAVLLELARLFHKVPPPMPVTIVLFDGEDSGRTLEGFCVGSRYFASQLGSERPDHAIVVDLVGGVDLRLPKELNSVNSDRPLTDLIWDVAERLGKQVFEDRVRGPIYDDHVPLIQAGIPAVDIIDLDYKYWHTLGDTPEHCSKDSLKAVGDVLVEVIYRELSL